MAAHSTGSETRGAASVVNAFDLPPTISVEEAADICGIGRNTAYRAAHRGELPSLRFGRRIRVPTGPLLELLGIDDPVEDAS